MLALNKVSLTIGNKAILNQVSLALPEQGMTAIVGPNGSGKSSLLSLMSQQRQPSSGEVTFASNSLKDYDRQHLAQKLSILRQDNHLDAKISVAELVTFGRFPYHRGQPSEQDLKMVEQAIAWADLTDVAQRHLDELSGGQRQRAFIAMILAQDTQTLLLDEPLNSLDMRHSVRLMQQFRQLARHQQKSVAVVLHDINFAARFCDRIIALKQGECFYQGDLAGFFDQARLSELYDMPVTVGEHNGRPLCFFDE